MTKEETTKTNPEPADESAGGQTSAKERFEIPECCRQVMAQMMGGSFCNSAKRGEGQPAEDTSASPGIFGRLMIRMMKACCGESTTKYSSCGQV